jgi:adenylosuccinate lyase
VVDTAFSLQCVQACGLIETEINNFSEVLKRRALEFKDLPCMGRTHGVHAEPMTFGMKLALAYDEMRGNLERLRHAGAAIAVGKLSGAVGTYSNLAPEVEIQVCRKLGLKALSITTQIIQRDRHAELMSALAIIAGSLERLATEIRGLQKTECGEAEEPFGQGQKGSSAMPHKKNPITCERVTGLARVLRGYAVTALENQALWHERDISHSSAERVIFPDAFMLLDYMLAKMAEMVDGLVVYPERMAQNLDALGGLVFSGRLLVALSEAGMTRDEAYTLVQHHAMEARKGGPTFKARVQGDMEIRRKLTPQILSTIFSLQDYLKHAPGIVVRTVSA